MKKLFPSAPFEDKFVDDDHALVFYTGLDPRSFAQAGYKQLFSESGVVVFPDGDWGTWAPEGVAQNTREMIIWGPEFPGERLDDLINDSERQGEALPALACWINAAFSMEKKYASGRCDYLPRICHWPCAAIIAGEEKDGGWQEYPAGAVLFLTENFSRRVMQAEGESAQPSCAAQPSGAAQLECAEQFVHPDLSGFESAAFCAGAMLYRVLAGTSPFPARNVDTLRQDIREGNCIPVRLAAPGIGEGLAHAIQQALSQKKNGAKNGEALLERFKEILKTNGQMHIVSAFFKPLSDNEKLQLEKEKARFIKRKRICVNARRFAARNISAIIGIAVAAVIVAIAAYGIAKSRAALPTTAGLSPAQVAQLFYTAFDSLDHQLMEACLARGAGKNDVNMVANIFAMTKVAQTVENRAMQFLPARQWLEAGSTLGGIPVFGIADLNIERLSGDEDSADAVFLASYTLWLPWPEHEDRPDENTPQAYYFTDELHLAKIKGNWRITGIGRNRSEKIFGEDISRRIRFPHYPISTFRCIITHGLYRNIPRVIENSNILG
jgi:hypothetical protein